MIRSTSLLLSIAAIVLLPMICNGQALSPYSVFQSMTVSDLQTAQLKLTYLGPQNAPVASVGLAASAFDPNVFKPFRQTGIDYSNEDFVVFKTSIVSAHDLMTIISNVGALSNVTAGGVASNPFVSFALSNTVGGTKVFEAVLNSVDGAALFNQLRGALLQSQNGLVAVSTMACPLGLLDMTAANDVTASVTVTFSGFRLNRTTGRYLGTVTVSNAGAMILGPVSLVVQFKGSVQLANALGATCGTSPTGILYVNVTSGNIGTGASATGTLDLANPNGDPIQTSLVKILAGGGSR